MADFSLSTNVNGEIVIIKTSGYLNNIGGEKIADACYKEIENNCKNAQTNRKEKAARMSQKSVD